MSGILQMFPFGGAPQSYWIATLEGANNQQGSAITIDSSGNTYIAGLTNSIGAGSQDAILAKFNANGILQWQRILGATGNDNFAAIKLDSSNNIYVCGVSNQGATGNDVLLAKYNNSGAIQWQITLDINGLSDIGAGIVFDSSNNFYISGRSGSTLFVAKYDSSGTIQWIRDFQATTFGYGITIDSSSNVYAVGFTSSSGAGSQDGFIVKYNSSGTIQWQRTLGGTAVDRFTGVSIDSSNNIYLIGFTTSQGSGNNDLLIVKYSSAGVIQWQRILGGSGTDTGQTIAIDSSSNVYVAGSSSISITQVVIVKYDSSGTIQWQRYFNCTNSDIGYAIAVDNNNNYYLTGFTQNVSTNNNIFVFKLPTDGSKTGTYGVWTYAASSFTAATSTLTDASSSLTESTPTYTSSTSTLTDAASTLTPTVTSVP